MQITGKDNHFEIRTKQSSVILDKQCSINGVALAGPGEYEVADCTVEGLPPSVYVIKAEDMTIAYLNRLATELTEDQIEELSEPDVVFVPTGAEGTIDAKTAEKLVKLIAPNVVIPMLGDVDEFVKLTGGSAQKVSALKISKATLPAEGRAVYVLG